MNEIQREAQERFQLIRFNPIGREDVFDYCCLFLCCFQLIRFNPIGRVAIGDRQVRESIVSN